MNKKGDSIKLFTYILASLIVSALIIVFFSTTVPSMMLGSVEDVVAKDFGLVIMTISASPYDITYTYEKNTEKYAVIITDELVRVQSREALGKYSYLPMQNVIIKNTIVEGVLSIPLTLQKNTLTFSSNAVGIEDFCSSIPMTFSENYLDVKIMIDKNSIPQNIAYLESIKAGIELRMSNIPDIRLTERNEDLLLILSADENIASIFYYESKDKDNDEGVEWIQRISCYNSKWITSKYPQLGEVTLMPNSDVNTMKIDFGKDNFIDGKFVITTSDASMEITNAIQLGITKYSR